MTKTDVRDDATPAAFVGIRRLYATVKGIRIARELARLCKEHVAFRWLCGGVAMYAKTLADFRVYRGTVLEQLLVDSFTALVQAGVASLEGVA